MKLRCFILLALVLQNVLMANATIVQKLLLKNGSQLEGYISSQRPGENFTFTAERAIIYVDGSHVKSITDYEVKIADLSKDWIDWAEANDAFVGLGSNRSLTLSDVVSEDRIVRKVRILEKGAKIKYLEIGKNSYALSWDTISVLQVDKRSKTALSGINRIYKLKNGQEYEGQYVEEVPGKTLSLYRDNGVVEVFETDDVVKYSMKKINPNQDLFEQSQLVDVVLLKNKAVLKGIIIEQNFSEKLSLDNYLLIQLENGNIQNVKLADIDEYKKEENPKYKALYDVLLKENELVINREQPQLVTVEERGSFIMLSTDTCGVNIEKRGTVANVVIETRFADNVQNPSLKIVKIQSYKDKKKKINFKGFSFEDVVKASIQPVSMETSINFTTKFEYNIEGTGLYAIYKPEEKSVILFNVK